MTLNGIIGVRFIYFVPDFASKPLYLFVKQYLVFSHIKLISGVFVWLLTIKQIITHRYSHLGLYDHEVLVKM